MLDPKVTRTLVTGGAGSLGSHLCERLLAMGRDVLCVDNLYTGTKRNVADFLQNPRFELMRHDVMHPNDGRVVSNFIVQALTNQSITLYGDGSQTRSTQPP